MKGGNQNRSSSSPSPPAGCFLKNLDQQEWIIPELLHESDSQRAKFAETLSRTLSNDTTLPRRYGALDCSQTRTWASPRSLGEPGRLAYRRGGKLVGGVVVKRGRRYFSAKVRSRGQVTVRAWIGVETQRERER